MIEITLEPYRMPYLNVGGYYKATHTCKTRKDSTTFKKATGKGHVIEITIVPTCLHIGGYKLNFSLLELFISTNTSIYITF